MSGERARPRVPAQGSARSLARSRPGLDANRVEVLALPDGFIDHGQRGEQLAAAGLDVDHLVDRLAARLAALRPGAPVRLVTGS